MEIVFKLLQVSEQINLYKAYCFTYNTIYVCLL